MQESSQPQPGVKPARNEEHWRLLLLVAAVVALAAFLVGLMHKAPLNGRVDPASHVDAKRKAETAKTKAEIDRRFKEGVEMLQAKEYQHALALFHLVLQLAPEMPEAYVNAGYASLGMGDARTARDFFEGATNLRSNQLNAYYGLAEALVELGDKFGAMQAMETYVHLAPKDDPFRRKAQSAAWELRTAIEEEKAAAYGTAPASGAAEAPKAKGKP